MDLNRNPKPRTPNPKPQTLNPKPWIAAGMDLNRKWRSPDRDFQPTVWAMKEMMCRVRDERGIDLFLDYHGHSVKNNIFIYGCDAKYWCTAPVHSSREEPKDMHSRIFPAQLDSICPMFSYEDCRFECPKP